MFCNDCGTRNSVDSKYCKECGSKVNDGYRTMMLTVEDLSAVEDDQSQQRLTRLLDMAFWHNEAGHTDAAIRASEAALKIHPLCTTAHSLLGTLYEKKGDEHKAIEHFEEVVRLNPDSEADVAKLEQVRQGIHAKAVVQPPGYRWVPPALAGLTVNTLAIPDLKKRLRKPNPMAISGAAALLVLAVGWVAIKASMPGPKANFTYSRVSTFVTPALVPSVVGLPSGVVNVPAGPISPVVLKPGTASKGKAKPFGPQIAMNGPFGEALPPGVPTAPLGRTPRSARTVRVASRPSVGGNNDLLPPLKLSAVPLPSQNLAPMPISGIASAPMPMASVASMPQHTVVVSRLASQGMAAPSPSLMTTYSGAPSGDSASAGEPPSHISIRISRSQASEAISISDHSSPIRHTAEAGGDGDAYQQSALDLQNQGDYRHARSAYQKAIHAYKTQIASGHDTETAKRGLQASQTGLQICDQSQP